MLRKPAKASQAACCASSPFSLMQVGALSAPSI